MTRQPQAPDHGKRWLDGIEHTKIRLSEVESVKGLEYQWVFVVIRDTLFQQLEHGFTGSSTRVYNQRRLLRVPFTRARDGLFTFVVPYRANESTRTSPQGSRHSTSVALLITVDPAQ